MGETLVENGDRLAAVWQEIRVLAAADACEDLFGWTPGVEGDALVLSTVQFGQAFHYLCSDGLLFGFRVIVEEEP